jgi:xanthine dehydrogenase/oxidase
MYNNKLTNGLSNGLSNGNGCPMGEQCCRSKSNEVTANGDCAGYEEVLFSKTEYTPYDPTQEPIFPPELRVCTLCSVEVIVLVLRSNWGRGVVAFSIPLMR